MDYTTSDGFETHVATGNRMHQDTAAVPTVLSAKDINALTWSLMEIVKAAGLTPQQFDPANVNTYRVLLAALKKVLIDRSGDADLTGDFKTSGTWTGAFALKLANAYINALGSQVIFNMDVNDYLQYRRDIDAFDFTVAGVSRLFVDQFGPGRNNDATSPNSLPRLSQVQAMVDEVRGSVTVLHGQIYHGSVLPLPAGYTEEQCRWIVSPYDYDSGFFDLREGEAQQAPRLTCKVGSGRVVEAQIVFNIGGWRASWANYIVIGVK